jgi:hypothetical protein
MLSRSLLQLSCLALGLLSLSVTGPLSISTPTPTAVESAPSMVRLGLRQVAKHANAFKSGGALSGAATVYSAASGARQACVDMKDATEFCKPHVFGALQRHKRHDHSAGPHPTVGPLGASIEMEEYTGDEDLAASLTQMDEFHGEEEEGMVSGEEEQEFEAEEAEEREKEARRRHRYRRQSFQRLVGELEELVREVAEQH